MKNVHPFKSYFLTDKENMRWINLHSSKIRRTVRSFQTVFEYRISYLIYGRITSLCKVDKKVGYNTSIPVEV